MLNAASILVCYAVREEVGKAVLNTRAEVLITGMGRRNAAECLQRRLSVRRPTLVLTCGFAGGLNPALPTGTVIFSAEGNADLSTSLLALGVVPVRFFCADRVAITALEKQQLRQTTGADAVEMESEIIRTLCQHQNLPSATIRVISDAAHEDLPLDFNALLTARHKIHFGKLAAALIRSPNKIPRLLEFQKRTTQARDALDRALAKLLAP